MTREEFQSEIDADKLKQAFERSLHRFPDNSVRPGETWERAEILDVSGKSFRVRRKYEYVAATAPKGDKTLDKIHLTMVEVKLEPRPEQQVALEDREKRPESGFIGRHHSVRPGSWAMR